MKKRIYTVFLFFACFLFLSMGGDVLVWAHEEGGEENKEESPQEDLEERKEKLEELQEKQESYSSIVGLKQKEAEVYDAQVRSLSAQAQVVSEDIQENASTLEQVQRDITSILQDIERKEAVITLQRELLAELLRSYFDRKNAVPFVTFAGDGSAEALFGAQDKTTQIQERVGDMLDEIRRLRDELEKNHDTLARQELDLENLRVRLEKQGEYLEGAQEQKRILLEQALTEKGKYAWRLSQVEEDIRKIEQEIASIEANKLNTLDLNNLPSAKKGLLAYPVGKPVRITQYYGKTSFTRWYTFHNGIDFGAPTGSAVYAPEDGNVIADGDSGNYAYGKWIAIEHKIDGKKLVTVYGHLSKKRVEKGDKVDEGDRIGDVGNTGYSTGSHLHFGVYSAEQFEISTINGHKIPTGAHVDPMRYLE